MLGEESKGFGFDELLMNFDASLVESNLMIFEVGGTIKEIFPNSLDLLRFLEFFGIHGILINHVPKLVRLQVQAGVAYLCFNEI